MLASSVTAAPCRAHNARSVGQSAEVLNATVSVMVLACLVRKANENEDKVNHSSGIYHVVTPSATGAGTDGP